MPRVTSQKTRQAVLVSGEPLDPNDLPEKLQLFNELGEPIMLGGGFARRQQTESTDVLEQGEIEVQTLTFYPSIRAFKIETNRPARVRVYTTAAQRNADLNRGVGVKPFGNHGRLLEVVTTDGLLELTLTPAVDMTSVDAFDEDFYASVTNLDGDSGAVDVTYHYFRTE